MSLICTNLTDIDFVCDLVYGVIWLKCADLLGKSTLDSGIPPICSTVLLFPGYLNISLSNQTFFPFFPLKLIWSKTFILTCQGRYHDHEVKPRFDVKTVVKSVGEYDLKDPTLSPLKKGRIVSVNSFLEKVGFLNEFVYGKYSGVGGGNLKNVQK